MMFIQLFSSGALTPILSLYLCGTLKFSGSEAGLILAMSSISALISPLVGAFIADRVINSERFLGICQTSGAVIMFMLSFQDRFPAFLVLYILYSMTMGPTFSLTNAIVLHHQPDAKKNYGMVRVWGTIGWISAAWVLGFLWRGGGSDTVQAGLRLALQVSAISSFVLGLYSFTLPLAHTKLVKPPNFLPVESLGVMLKPSVLIISALSLFINIVDRYYYFGTAPYLKSAGFHDGVIMPLMSIGQLPEILAMMALGLILSRFSVKTVLAAGALVEFLRFTVLASGGPPALLIAALSMHGLTYVFYSISALIYLDGFCDKKSRTGVQQMFCIIAVGLGSFLGSMIAGGMMDLFRASGGQINYTFFWMVPALISAAVFGGILVFIRGGGLKIGRNAVRNAETESTEAV